MTVSRMPTSATSRGWQALLILSAAISAWLGMQAVHELGHVVGAWLTGGNVERVVLHPLAISRTDVAPNPEPLVVVWAGPIVGVLLPLAFWGIVAAAGWRGAWAARFFAGFCLLANGLYIGIGSFEGIGDAGDMLAAGSPDWTLWLFGLVTAPLGLALWNGLGKWFGFGREAPQVPARRAIASAVVLLGLLLASLGYSAAVP
jgi:hypothetical protein